MPICDIPGLSLEPGENLRKVLIDSHVQEEE